MDEELRINEIMICTAAKEIKDEQVILVGVGLPVCTAFLAKNTIAPNACLMVELGMVDLSQEVIKGPGFFGLEITPNCSIIGSLTDVLGTMVQGGWVDLGFVGSAQIDRFGNINTSVIGDDYKHPKVKLPGSGGACDLATLAKENCVITRHGKSKIVDKVDFITSPGFLTGGNSRFEAGITERSRGPRCVITDMGVFRFDSVTHEMYMESYHPGVTPEQILENTGFDLKIAPDVHETEIDMAMVRALRKLDPYRFYS